MNYSGYWSEKKVHWSPGFFHLHLVMRKIKTDKTLSVVGHKGLWNDPIVIPFSQEDMAVG